MVTAKNKKEEMKKLFFVAAALAAGVSSFAAMASDRDHENLYVVSANKTSAQVTKQAAKSETRAVKKAEAKKSSARKVAKSTKKSKAASVAARKTSGKVAAIITPKKALGLKARVSKAVARKRALPQIDTMTTASVVKTAVRPNRAGIEYSDIISRYAASYGVPASLAHAVIRVESNYRANARGSAGEIGLMQIKPATARMMGYTGSANGLFNPETNIKFGMKYLAMAHKLGGGATCGTILRYNAGHAATRMNPVSSAYCSKVKQHLAGA
jgi:soluble lytic murein transglycosylase-like protein